MEPVWHRSSLSCGNFSGLFRAPPTKKLPHRQIAGILSVGNAEAFARRDVMLRA
jgi:hypothetical protein